jgi:hypothetical protein
MKISLLIKSFFFLIAFFCLLLAFSPASWLFKTERFEALNVHFSHVDDYWWRAHMADVSVVVRGYRLLLGDIDWRYDFNSLVTLKYCAFFSTKAQWLRSEGKVCYDLTNSTVVLNAVNLNMAVDEIAAITGVEASGNFEGFFSRIVFHNGQLAAVNGDAAWKNTQWHNGEKWLVLGETLLAFATLEALNEITIQWLDIDSPISIDVTAVVQSQQLNRIYGYISPNSFRDKSLLDTLGLLSQDKQEGRYIFDAQFH